jgi:hypothetical protein
MVVLAITKKLACDSGLFGYLFDFLEASFKASKQENIIHSSHGSMKV